MNLYKRMCAPTPKRNRKLAKILGYIGGVCAGILTLVTAGVIVLPVAVVTAVAIGSVALGGAVFHAQKVELPVKNVFGKGLHSEE